MAGMLAWAETKPKASGAATPVVDLIGDGKIDWTKMELRARGFGVAPAFAKTPAQITTLAREAAIMAAERNLLKVINGVKITSDTTVETLVLKNDATRSRVSGLLKGAVIVSEGPYKEVGYEVVMATSIYGKKSLAQSIDLAGQLQVAAPHATIIPPASKEESASPVTPAPAKPVEPATPPENVALAREAYTGIVIDCRGLDLSRALCPRLLDQDHNNLWDLLAVSVELVNDRGIAGYFHADDPALPERVGKHPLTVKACAVSGHGMFKTDGVISTEDAARLRAENARSLFLNKLNLALLVDQDK